MMAFPFYRQPDQMDCGPTCLRMIAKHYGRTVSLAKLRELAETTRGGSSLKTVSDASEKLGFRSLGVKIDYNTLINEVPLPCVLHWNQNHFVVAFKAKKGKVSIADPGHGIIQLSEKDFLSSWIGSQASATTEEGIALLLEPTPRLKEVEEDDIREKTGFRFLYQYLFRYKKFIAQLIVGLIAGSLLQLIFPFLTQSVVDIGIQNQDINFVYLILIAQLFLFAGRIGIELIRGWILLHLSTRINISLISDFFIKLMNLPIAFFDSKMTGDIMQRIGDHQRIENLLTTTSLNVLFSTVNLFIFGAVLAYYNVQIFLIFIAGSVLYFLWVTLFLKKRKDLDYKRFDQMSNESTKIMELINGMQEIKLHNAEKQKRWGWEYLQARLFKIEMASLKLQQAQSTGANVINELKNILITILAAKLVIDGDLTLGMMVAVTYIIGQLNGPIQQLISFVYTVQDARIALERLAEIHNKADEEKAGEQKVYDLPEDAPIVLDKISFRYPGSTENVIDDLSLLIPANKITAIVGASGSGKTTLMKILLKFYEVSAGSIKVANADLNSIAQQYWRNKCGVVMQEGYIFDDTIANNIAVGDTHVDKKKLIQAVTVANIKDYIEDLPLSYNTKIGADGVGMSGGQKQRLLIARAVYKSPEIICFDEATSALDAKNERVIMEHLNTFFKDRTAIVIAHRLSTVKNADQIVVLDSGKVIEKGTHEELVELKGSYFSLVKNQLDLEKLNDK